MIMRPLIERPYGGNMAGSAGDTLRHVSDNPTGAGDIPVVSLDQVENMPRPGGRSHKPSGSPEAPALPESSRPGGPQSTAGADGDGDSAELFPRPGGAQGWKR